MTDVSRRIVESFTEAEGDAMAEFQRLLSEVPGADDSSKYMGEPNPAFAGVAVATSAELEPWFAESGYKPFAPGPDADQGASSLAWVNPEKGVIVTVQPAFGNVVTAGFADSPTHGRRDSHRDSAPDAGPQRGNGEDHAYPMSGGSEVN